MTKKFPEDFVKVGWKNIALEPTKASFKKDNSDYWGQFTARENKIEVQEEAEGIDLANTLLHEVLHAIVYHSSLNQDGGALKDGGNCEDREEQAVNSISNWLMGVFRDNPWFLPFLMENIDTPKSNSKKSK
tara:strand:+ start:4208 stop:4600 length:393 start_codon:yes stop_codon:yes gene_type:complete